MPCGEHWRTEKRRREKCRARLILLPYNLVHERDSPFERDCVHLCTVLCQIASLTRLVPIYVQDAMTMTGATTRSPTPSPTPSRRSRTRSLRRKLYSLPLHSLALLATGRLPALCLMSGTATGSASASGRLTSCQSRGSGRPTTYSGCRPLAVCQCASGPVGQPAAHTVMGPVPHQWGGPQSPGTGSGDCRRNWQ
jgi:hypothetical protein